MRIQITEPDGLKMEIPIPNSLLFHPVAVKLWLKQIKKQREDVWQEKSSDMGRLTCMVNTEVFSQLSKEEMDAFAKEWSRVGKGIQKNFGEFTLVDIRNADGGTVKITL